MILQSIRSGHGGLKRNMAGGGDGVVGDAMNLGSGG
jgi:hypothetical protein